MAKTKSSLRDIIERLKIEGYSPWFVNQMWEEEPEVFFKEGCITEDESYSLASSNTDIELIADVYQVSTEDIPEIPIKVKSAVKMALKEYRPWGILTDWSVGDVCNDSLYDETVISYLESNKDGVSKYKKLVAIYAYAVGQELLISNIRIENMRVFTVDGKIFETSEEAMKYVLGDEGALEELMVHNCKNDNTILNTKNWVEYTDELKAVLEKHYSAVEQKDICEGVVKDTAEVFRVGNKTFLSLDEAKKYLEEEKPWEDFERRTLEYKLSLVRTLPEIENELKRLYKDLNCPDESEDSIVCLEENISCLYYSLINSLNLREKLGKIHSRECEVLACEVYDSVKYTAYMNEFKKRKLDLNWNDEKIKSVFEKLVGEPEDFSRNRIEKELDKVFKLLEILEA